MGALDDAALRKMGLPWSEDLVERTLAEVAGTILTADLALAAGRVGTLHRVILQSKHQLMTAGPVWFM
jgi:hypothetical protein